MNQLRWRYELHEAGTSSPGTTSKACNEKLPYQSLLLSLGLSYPEPRVIIPKRAPELSSTCTGVHILAPEYIGYSFPICLYINFASAYCLEHSHFL
jgi:hypothetical protein